MGLEATLFRYVLLLLMGGGGSVNCGIVGTFLEVDGKLLLNKLLNDWGSVTQDDFCGDIECLEMFWE